MSRFVRIYLPLSANDLGSLADGEVPAGDDRQVYAVTDAFRAVMPASEDTEGLEFAVLQDAAVAAATRGWRVIGAADIAAGDVTAASAADSPAQVTVTGAIGRRRFASLHVLDPAGERDPDADMELSWYDITELDEVRRIDAT